jgi:hypothetical protein
LVWRDLALFERTVRKIQARRRNLMADIVRKVSYCNVVVPSRIGQGAKVLSDLKDAGVDMLGYSGFPISGRNAQLDLVTQSMPALRRLARGQGWRLSKAKKSFWIQGQDKVGAIHRHITRLADVRINITAASAVSAGKGRYGMLLWVKQKDYARAARALRAR